MPCLPKLFFLKISHSRLDATQIQHAAAGEFLQKTAATESAATAAVRAAATEAAAATATEATTTATGTTPCAGHGPNHG
jgi:hypothetical protein